MKKAICLLMPLIMLCLSSCGQKKNKLVELNPDITYANPPGVVFETEKEVYSQEDTNIAYKFSSSEEYVGFNPFYLELHKLEDGGWKQVDYKEGAYFIALAIDIEPNEWYEFTFELEEFFYMPLEKGEYRIGSETVITNNFMIE